MRISIIAGISRIFSYTYLKKIQAVLLLLVFSFHIIGTLPFANATIGVIGTIVTPESPGVSLPDMFTLVGTKLYVNSHEGGFQVIDTTTNRTISNTLNAGGSRFANAPVPVIVGTKLYITNQTQSRVDVVDTTTDTLLPSIPLPGEPNGCIASGNKLYVFGDLGGAGVVIIDTTNDMPMVPITSFGASGYKLALVGTNIYVSTNIGLFMIDTTTDTVSQINAYNYEFTSFRLVGTKLYITNWYANNITVIDTLTNTELTTVPTGSHPIKTSLVGTKLYVNQTDSIGIIDTTTDTMIGSINSVGYNSGLESIVVGTKLYFDTNVTPTSTASSTFSVVDTTTDTIIGTIPLGGFTSQHLDAILVGTNIYIGNHTYHTISVIDTNTDMVIHTIPPQSYNQTLNSSTAVGTKLYVNDPISDYLSVIDTTTDMIIGKVFVGSFPQSSTAVGTKLYVNNTNPNSVSVVDTSTDTVMKEILLVGSGLVSSTAIGTKLYISHANSRTVSVIDMNTDTLITTLSIGISITPEYGNTIFSTAVGNKLYVSNYIDSTVSVIDTTTDTIISTISTVGTNPISSTAVGTKLYVNNVGHDIYGGHTGGGIDLIDTTTDTIIHTFAAYSPRSSTLIGNKLYINGGLIPSVGVLDTTVDDSIWPWISVGSDPIFSTAVGTKLYVNQAGNVSVIDSNTNGVIQTISLGTFASQYSIGSLWSTLVGTKLYAVANWGTIKVIDTTNNFTLNYTAGSNGSLSGSTSQVVDAGNDGTTVSALSDSGYIFTGWSDGNSQNPRTDLNVNSNKNVIANFQPYIVPSVVDDSFTLPQYSSEYWLDIFSNDDLTSNPETGFIPIILTQTSSGILNIQGSDVYYTPQTEFCGTDSFTYQVQDAYGTLSNTGNVTLNVTCKEPPIGVEDFFTVDQYSQNNPLDILLNDTGADGNQIYYSDVTTYTSSGNLDIYNNRDGDYQDFYINYTPNPDFCGEDTFIYRVDGNGSPPTSPTTVHITVNCLPNTPPISVDDHLTDFTTEDTESSFQVGDILSNDTDPDTASGDSIVGHQIVDYPSNGYLWLDGDMMMYFYSPNSDFCGTDTFTYQAQDSRGFLSENVATVSIDVLCMNDAPYALDDEATGSINSPLNISPLENDIDLDLGDMITLVSVSDGISGTTLISGTGIIYTPQTDFCGDDTLTYTTQDQSGAVSNTGNIFLHILCSGNHAPVAVDDLFTVIEDSSGNILDVLSNDTDTDSGDTLTLSGIVSFPFSGSLILSGSTELIYTPNLDFCGTDTFTYRVSDTFGPTLSNIATGTLMVSCQNDAPIAVDDFATGSLNTALSIPVLNNDTDIDMLTNTGEILSLFSVSTGVHGTANITGTGVLYTSFLDFCGNDTLSYRVQDQSGALSNTGTVYIFIACGINTSPTAVDDTGSVIQSGSVFLPVLLNDLDAELDTLTIGTFTVPLHGTLSQTSSGFLYTSSPTYCGTDVFTYIALDPLGLSSNTGTVHIDVINCVPDTLITSGISDGVTSSGKTQTFTFTSTLPLSTFECRFDTSTFSSCNTPIAYSGLIDGSHTFIVRAVSGSGIVDPTPESRTFTVYTPSSPIPPPPTPNGSSTFPPVAVDDIMTVMKNSTGNILNAVENDTDPNAGDTLFLSQIVSQTTHGVISISGSTSVVYTPISDFCGKDIFTYKIRDTGSLESNIATGTFIIPCSNILPVAMNDFATGSKDTFLSLDILANDQDTDGKGLTISGIVLFPKHGVLSISGATSSGVLGTGSLNFSGATSLAYFPDSHFCGKDMFTYQAQGFSGGVTNTATGYIMIRCSIMTGGTQGEISYSSAPNYPTIPVENTITDFICPTIVKVFDENELRATDIPNNEFADDIKAILMYRGLERDEKNLGLSTLRYRNDGIAINDSEFESNRGTTRAEFVKVLVRALACHYRFIGTDSGFPDVPNDRWYAEYINFAVKNKWIDGYADGTFRPDAMITRGEAAKVLANAIHLSGQTRKEDVPFIDVHSQSEFTPYIVALAENDIISIPTDGFYRPDDFISRPEFSKIVRRTFLNIEIQK